MPYIAVAEIARLMLDSPADSHTAIWTWVGVGAADAAILHDVRVRIVTHLGKLPLGWFRAAGSGKVKRAMTGDLEEMHEVIAHALGQLVGATTVMTVATGYLLFVDVRMAFVVLGVLLLMGIFFRISMRSMTTHMNRLVVADARISAASVEYADGIQVVKTFGTGGRVLRRFDDAVDNTPRRSRPGSPRSATAPRPPGCSARRWPSSPPWRPSAWPSSTAARSASPISWRSWSSPSDCPTRSSPP
ncbi:ABC transporter transmembrane domain-containing protein [Streptomyces sp. wa1064]|uniref:ABC transporter transmembrane domain-containing protein n=1 Tax=Streptomyces sp. wa1064 TaxID=1828213 RepID=UPI003C7E7880